MEYKIVYEQSQMNNILLAVRDLLQVSMNWNARVGLGPHRLRELVGHIYAYIEIETDPVTVNNPVRDSVLVMTSEHLREELRNAAKDVFGEVTQTEAMNQCV